VASSLKNLERATFILKLEGFDRGSMGGQPRDLTAWASGGAYI
jgi:hypothetical protein